MIVLKIIGWVLLGILTLILLALCVKVRFEIEYSNENTSALLKWLFLKIKLYPTKKKPKAKSDEEPPEKEEETPKEEEEPTCCTENHVYLRRLSGEEEETLAPEEKESGSCGSNVAKPTCQAAWKKEWIFGLVNAFAQDSKLHKSTGGTHSCMLAVEDQILYQAEDIGRHNALDKAVGYAVRNQLDRRRCILFTTGRVPTDMLKKVIRAGIPILVSKAIPTADAVELAKANGIALICRAWPDSFEVYA
mgnify:CR=1 FL=1